VTFRNWIVYFFVLLIYYSYETHLSYSAFYVCKRSIWIRILLICTAPNPTMSSHLSSSVISTFIVPYHIFFVCVSCKCQNVISDRSLGRAWVKNQSLFLSIVYLFLLILLLMGRLSRYLMLVFKLNWKQYFYECYFLTVLVSDYILHLTFPFQL
jgi:hypothetical protein